MKISSQEAALRLFEVFGTMVAVYLVSHIAHGDPEFIIDVIIVPLLVIMMCEFVHAKYIAPKEQREQLAHQLLPLRLQMQKITECLASGDIAPRLMIKVLGRASAHVTASELDEVWNQLTWSLTKNYFATNYIDYNAMFGNRRAQAILATQRAKMLAGEVEIAKVFIVDDAAEIATPKAKGTLQLHRREGIDDLSYIVRGDIAKRLRGKFTIDPNKIDFAIFDDHVVLFWRYDDQRHIESGELLFGEAEVKPYREFAANLKSVAIKCPL